MGQQALEEDRLITLGVQRRRARCCHCPTTRHPRVCFASTKALLWQGFPEVAVLGANQ
jgi:hypothetical protein